MIRDRIELLDDILAGYRGAIGDEFGGYRNHVYRMVNFCLALGDMSDEETEKIVIAGCFHDIGIWTGGTFDYLPPSIVAANEYLDRKGLGSWSGEITSMIDEHHRLRTVSTDAGRLAEIFRKGDLVDFSLGFVNCGLPRQTVAAVKRQFPNAGFHKCLVKLAGRWICRHPLNPIPVLKW